MKSRVGRLCWLTSVALAVCLAAAFEAQAQAPELSQDAPEVVFGSAAPEIQAKADALGHDAVRIYEFVRNEVEYEHYYGVLKGPRATLAALRGNDYDQAELLVSLLRASGIPARFVRGRVRLDGTQINNWLGTTIVNGYSGYLFIRRAELAPVLNDPIAGSSWAAGLTDFLHVWVEAQVPMAEYRGSSPLATPSSTSKIWVPLDPSFKYRAWRPDPGLPIGSTPELNFDLDSPNGYYRKIETRLPSEVLADQVRDYIGAHRPDLTPADGSYLGPIIEERPGVLPNSLPYVVLSSPLTQRHTSLAPLHCFTTSTDSVSCPGARLSPTRNAGSDGPEDYRFKWLVHVERSGTTLLDYSDWAPNLVGKRVSIHFEPTGSACTQTNRVFVVLDVNGSPVVSSQNTAGQACSVTSGVTALTIRISSRYPSPGSKDDSVPPPTGVTAPDPILVKSEHPVTAAGVYVIGLAAGDSSPATTASITQKLLDDQSTRFPVRMDAVSSQPFVDDSPTGQTGVKDASEKFLSERPDAQEALIGGLLHLASARYMDIYDSGRRVLEGLHQQMELGHPAVGLISSSPQISYVLDAPFPTHGGRLVVDIQGNAILINDRLGTYLDRWDQNIGRQPRSSLRGRTLSSNSCRRRSF